MVGFENRAGLCDHGNAAARRTLLDVAADALADVQPARLLEGRVAVEGDRVVVDGVARDVRGGCYVVGAGKGASAAAKALRSRLGDRVDGGVVVEKRGQRVDVEDVTVVEAGHPLPDEDGLDAAASVLALADAVGPDDLVFVVVTGGASALLAAPAEGLDLSALRATTSALLEAGAPIEDVNAVRKHLSALKGGFLAERLHPATTVSLVLVDEVAGEPWGPTVPDETTYGDAIEALERHGLWDSVPDSVRDRLTSGRDGERRETPSAAAFEALETQSVVLGDATTLCDAAERHATARGYEATVLSSVVEGESREVARCLAAVAREAAERGQPLSPPCVFVSGGETTVNVCADPGEGGPNQEFALASALALGDREDVTVLAIGTDGTDGPTDLAGGLVDRSTVTRASERGVDLEAHLARNDAGGALRRLGDAVVTGATGTNLMDLRLTLVE